MRSNPKPDTIYHQVAATEVSEQERVFMRRNCPGSSPAPPTIQNKHFPHLRAWDTSCADGRKSAQLLRLYYEL
jgi:hypothetical protein